MDVQEFFKKYKVHKTGEIYSCDDCALSSGNECGEYFLGGCPLPPLYNFKLKENGRK